MLPRNLPHKLRRLQWLLLVAAALLVVSCAGRQQGPSGGGEWVLPDYELRVYQVGTAQHDADGYEMMLRFELTSSSPFPFDSLVQEIVHETTYVMADGSTQTSKVTLVEAFRLRDVTRSDGPYRYRLHPYQRDRHFESGFATFDEKLVNAEVRRTVSIYPARVLDADYTDLGFAHLPRNRSGNLHTRVPENFNRRYQEKHQTQGRIVADDRVSAQQYRLQYLWRRTDNGRIRTHFRFEDVNGVRWPLSRTRASVSHDLKAADLVDEATGTTVHLAHFNQLADEVR